MKTKLIIILFISVFLFFSCSPQTEKIQMNSDNTSDTEIIQIDNPGNTAVGNLKIIISENAEKDFSGLKDFTETKTAVPDIDMTRELFRITATCTDGSSFWLTTQLSSIQIQGVPVGTWRIQIESINKDKISIAYGQAWAEIAESETSEITIDVTPYAGFGIMEITVNWAQGAQNPVIEGTLSQNNGPNYKLTFEIQGNSARAYVTGAAGYYLLRLNLYDAVGQMYLYIGGAVEIIRIIENETTPGVYAILANSDYGYGNINIGINVDMKDPIDIQLTGQAASIYEGQTMTITASSPGETEIVEYTWYLNGEQVGMGSVFTTRADLPAGPYRLDVTVFNEAGDRGGSVSYVFEILTSPPANLTYSQNPAVYAAGLAIQDNVATVTGSGITFSVTPSLPEGLTLNAATGVISGTPLNSQVETIYTVTATNYGGSTSVDLSITINTVFPVLAVTDFDTDHIDLSWTYNFPNISGYEIYRSTVSEVYDYNNPLAVIPTTLGSYSYTDNTVEDSTTYYFVIRAYYGSIFSNNSNEVNATTPSGFNEYLMGYWMLDSNLLDSVGTNNGTAYGSPLPVYVAGHNGQPNKAIRFNAANSNYVNFGTSKFNIAATNQFTVAFWLRLDSTTFNTIITKGQYAMPFFISRYSGTTRLQWPIRTDDTYYSISNQSLTVGTWYHITMNYGNGFTKLYINGIEDKSTALSGTLGLGGSNEDLVIGASQGGGNCSDISISNLRIYNICLSSEDINSIYSAE